MYLFGATIFADSESTIHMSFLTSLANLNVVGTFAWGRAAFYQLYWHTSISCCRSVLQLALADTHSWTDGLQFAIRVQAFASAGSVLLEAELNHLWRARRASRSVLYALPLPRPAMALGRLADEKMEEACTTTFFEGPGS
ncbi:conserved hypothetical protein [Ricinus communis]|uniref:Aminotransferase-like plant mobile domain-containing protein n=1 Tax=Ricinus communis TaxID=3988 RepID=B9RPW8_RICCO|nr:conserved hypothetical protein [Ricinus communis]